MPREKPIGLVSAVPFESRSVIGEMKDGKPGPYGIVKGKIAGTPVVHATSGIGAVNAAHAATLIIERYSPWCIVVFGIGGSYPSSGLRAGELAAATKEVYADLGVLTAHGLKGMEETGIELLRKGGRQYWGEFVMDKAPLKAIRRVGDISEGVFLTVSQTTGTLKRALELQRKYSAVCENLEGAAVAHVCAIHGVAVGEVRGISNTVEDRNMDKWKKNEAAENCQVAVIKLIELLGQQRT